MLVNCVICSDIFTPSAEISGTSCGHLFHYVCVTQWLERSKTCPQCRTKTTEKSLHRVYFNVSNSGSATEDTSSLQNRLDSISFDMRLKNMEIKKAEEEKDMLAFQTSGLKAEVTHLEKNLGSHKSTIAVLKNQIKFLQSESKDVEKAKNEAQSLRAELKMLENVQAVVKGTASDVEEVIQSYPVSATSIKSLGAFVSILKKEIKIVGEKRKTAQATLASTESKLREAAKENRNLRSTNESSTTKIYQLEEDILHLETTKKSLEKKVDKLVAAILSPSDSNPQSRVLRRLISESPAPEEAKRLRLTNPMEENTSPVRNSSSNAPNAQMPSSSPQLACKSSSVGIGCLLTPKPNQPKVSKPPTFRFKVAASSGASKFSIFNRGRLDSSRGGTAPRNEGLCYDGMGGQSYPDVFPQPRPVVPKGLLLKKTKSMSALPKSKLKPPANTPKLSHFFAPD